MLLLPPPIPFGSFSVSFLQCAKIQRKQVCNKIVTARYQERGRSLRKTQNNSNLYFANSQKMSYTAYSIYSKDHQNASSHKGIHLCNKDTHGYNKDVSRQNKDVS